MQGFKSIMLKDEESNPTPVYSIARGLDYPSMGPEYALFNENTRRQPTRRLWKHLFFCPDKKKLYSVAYAIKQAKSKKKCVILANLSGSDDKDLDYVVNHHSSILSKQIISIKT